MGHLFSLFAPKTGRDSKLRNCSCFPEINTAPSGQLVSVVQAKSYNGLCLIVICKWTTKMETSGLHWSCWPCLVRLRKALKNHDVAGCDFACRFTLMPPNFITYVLIMTYQQFDDIGEPASVQTDDVLFLDAEIISRIAAVPLNTVLITWPITLSWQFYVNSMLLLCHSYVTPMWFICVEAECQACHHPFYPVNELRHRNFLPPATMSRLQLLQGSLFCTKFVILL